MLFNIDIDIRRLEYIKEIAFDKSQLKNDTFYVCTNNRTIGNSILFTHDNQGLKFTCPSYTLDELGLEIFVNGSRVPNDYELTDGDKVKAVMYSSKEIIPPPGFYSNCTCIKLAENDSAATQTIVYESYKGKILPKPSIVHEKNPFCVGIQLNCREIRI